MRKLRKKYPIWVSIFVTLLFPLASLVGSLPLLAWEQVWDYGEYLPTMLGELVVLALMALVMALLRMQYVLRPGGKGVGKCLMPMLPVLLLYTYSLLGEVILYAGEPVRPPLQILWFVLCMLSIGVTEELVFRGLITRMIFEKYGRSAVGVWLSVLVSSLLFGGVHLLNAAGGAVSIGSVLVQVVGAMALGMCLAAAYLRTNSLWAVALIHGYMDFCALLASGVFAVNSIAGVIDEASPLQLAAAVLYTLLAIFLLRPSQMKQITGSGQAPAQGDVIKIMLAVMLASGLFSTVAVLML